MELNKDEKSGVISTLGEEQNRECSTDTCRKKGQSPNLESVLNELILGGLRPFMTDWSKPLMPLVLKDDCRTYEPEKSDCCSLKNSKRASEETDSIA